MTDVAPAIRCAMFLLKVAAPIGKISAGIDFPIPMESIEKLANKLISDLLKDKLDKIFSSKPILEFGLEEAKSSNCWTIV